MMNWKMICCLAAAAAMTAGLSGGWGGAPAAAGMTAGKPSGGAIARPAQSPPQTPPQADGEDGGRTGGAADNRELQRRFPNTVVLHGPSQPNRVALTFDDGPDSRFTPQVLDVLNKYGVKATFFLMGSRVKGHPEMTRRIQREGHSIGSHTYWHPRLTDESLDRLRWEVRETDKAIREAVGYSPRQFRAPFGALNEDIVRALAEMGYTIVGWSVDSLDWTQADAQTVERNIMAGLHPGAIVLQHSGGNWDQDLSGTVQALDALIPRLQAQGVEFVTVPQLIGIPEQRQPAAS